MHKLLYMIIAAALASTGCLGTLSSSERAELARLRQKDYDARVQRAREDGYRPPGAPQMPATSPKPPDVSGSFASGNASGAQSGYATGVAVVRGEYAVYVGTVGSEPRQVTIGRKLKLVNHVCDGGSRNSGLGCADADNDGYADFNTVLAFELEGKPVVCGSQGLLMPNQTCFVEVGRNRRLTLTVKRHRVYNTRSRIMIDPQPDDSFTTENHTADNNDTNYDVHQFRF